MKRVAFLTLVFTCGAYAQTQISGRPEPPACVVGSTCTTALTPRKLAGVLYATQFTGSDIGAQVNAAIAALPGNCGTIEIPAQSAPYAWNTTIIKPRCVNIRGQGALTTQLAWSSTAASTALVVEDHQSYGSTAAVNTYPEGEISDLSLVGSGIGYPTIGLYVGGDPTGSTVKVFLNGSITATVIPNTTALADHQNFDRIRLSGWGTAVQYGTNTYMDTFLESLITNNGVGVYWPNLYAVTSQPNAGESMDFIRDSIQNNTTGMNIVGFGDFYFYALSCDYNTTCGNVNFGHFYGAHIEQYTGTLITITGTSQPVVDFHGGFAVLQNTTGTDAEMFNVPNSSAAPNPSLYIDGMLFQSGHTVKNVVNWNPYGSYGSLSLGPIPYFPASPRLIVALTNAVCNASFANCHIKDQLGNESQGGTYSFLTAAGALFAQTLATPSFAVTNSAGYAMLTGGEVSGVGGLELLGGAGYSPVYLSGSTLNGFGVDFIANSISVGSSAINPVKWSAQGTVPTGSCNTGAMISDTSGAANSTFFGCEAGAWVVLNSVSRNAATGTCTPTGKYVSLNINGSVVHVATCN